MNVFLYHLVWFEVLSWLPSQGSLIKAWTSKKKGWSSLTLKPFVSIQPCLDLQHDARTHEALEHRSLPTQRPRKLGLTSTMHPTIQTGARFSSNTVLCTFSSLPVCAHSHRNGGPLQSKVTAVCPVALFPPGTGRRLLSCLLLISLLLALSCNSPGGGLEFAWSLYTDDLCCLLRNFH